MATLTRTVVAVVVAMTITWTALPAASASADPADSTSGIAARLDRRIHQAPLGRDVTMAVIDVTTGDVVYAHDAAEPQLTASTMKLVTATNALASMGADHRLATRVYVDRQRHRITLVCGGDPLLTSGDLRTLAKRAARVARRKHPVHVIIDARLFPPSSSGPGWTGSYQPRVVAPVTCLGRLGDHSSNPLASSAAVFTSALRSKGVRVTNTAILTRGKQTPVAGRLAGTVSHSVRQAVLRMLLVSENNIAEVLFRQSAIARGLPPTWLGGRQSAQVGLGELGIDTTRARLMDGSGVSRADRLTALALAQLASVTRTDPRFASMYATSGMPRSGRTGTLAARYQRFTNAKTRCARGDIRAKTGTLRDTVSLAGIARGAAPGQRFAFAVLVNHRTPHASALTVRQSVDRLAATLTGCR